MKRPARPRHLTFRGTVFAAGFITHAPLPEHQRRARVLAAWSPGTTVYRLHDREAYFVHWPQPRPLTAASAPGAPVVTRDQRWMTAPLERHEYPNAEPGTLLWVLDGRVQAFRIADQAAVDLADWVDPGPTEVVAVRPLGPPPTSPPAVARPAALDLRAAIGLPAADPARTRALARALDGGLPDASVSAAAQTPAWRQRAARWLSSLAAWLRSRAPAADSSRQARSDGHLGGDFRRPVEGESRGSLVRRLADWISSRGVGWVLGAWHQRYLDRLLGMFESGQLQDALRHAIPVGGDRPSAGQALRPPAPRRRLEFGRPEGPVRTISGDPDAWTQLERFYQRAVERLLEQEKYKEAAFVLAELLGRQAEAVAMLERVQQTRLAAELAEATHLEPALRVRLWAQAGEWTRAVRLARRHQVFAEAIVGLKGQTEVKAKLTALWAAHLAEVGDYVGAIERVWPQAKPSQEWMDAARRMGGATAARVLAKQLVVTPDAYSEVVAEAEAILADDSPEGAHARRALAEGLIDEPGAPGGSVLARAVVRALIADGPQSQGDRARIRNLVNLTGDRVMNADLPPLRAAATDDLESSVNLTIDATDRGHVAVTDAVRLATGRMLLALGEAGVQLCTADGRPLMHFKVPATHLVPSDAGHRALALIRRGSLHLIHRIDLVHRRATPWCELALGSFAETFDGWQWIAAVGSPPQVQILDVTARHPTVDWNANVMNPLLIARDDKTFSFLGLDADWIDTFDLAELRLTSRQDVPPPPGEPGEPPAFVRPTSALSATGTLSYLVRPRQVPTTDDEQTQANEWVAVRIPDRIQQHIPGSALAVPVAMTHDRARFMVAFRERGATTIGGFDWGNRVPKLTATLRGATQVGLRICADRWVIWDDLGRILTVHPARPTIEHSLRTRV